MNDPEYMKIPFKYFPSDIIEQYKIQGKVHSDGFIYVKIIKGMYGLKQAAILAYDNLIKNLRKHHYRPIPNTVGMW